MVSTEPTDRASASLVLTEHITPWLRAITAFGIISLITTVLLLFVITYKLVSWQIRAKKTSQFVVLIFNLLLADVQQAVAFLLNVEWLRQGKVNVTSPICFGQGWLVSTGDLGSGVWCFAIALHTFASVIFNYRLRSRYFYLSIFLLWSFIFGVSCIGIAMHGHSLYVRSGVWCWIDQRYGDLRLWTHYLWIFIFEFANIIIYALIYAILLHRIRCGFYKPEEAKRVRSIANLMVVYPLIYVVCTLPLASARMATMSGHPASYARLALSGAMITSNGWLDVLLYTCTRRIMILSETPPEDENGIDTFSTFWLESQKKFGSHCHVEALQPTHKSRRGRSKVRTKVPLPSASESSDDLCDFNGKDIKLVTTAQVTSEPATKRDFDLMEAESKGRATSPPPRWSSDSFESRTASSKDIRMEHHPR